ncbi:MAG: hypothetical protein AAGU12_00730 [Clostridiales bacterium]
MLKSKRIRQREPGKNPGLPYLLTALLLLAWFLTTHFQLLPPYLLPKPLDTFRALVRFAAPGATGPYGGTLWVHLWHSLGRVCRGFGLAAGAGLLLGYLCENRGKKISRTPAKNGDPLKNQAAVLPLRIKL